MAQLTGKNIRTEIRQLEIVSDDGNRVITIEQTNDGNVQLIERDANAEPWAWEGRTVYTLKADQRTLVTTAINRSDASYYRTQLDDVVSTRFQIPQPETEKVEEENCSPIAIADAQAAAALAARDARIEAVKFELRLDHTRYKHVSADVEGCPLCDAKVIIPTTPVTPEEFYQRYDAVESESNPNDQPF
jgi:hypothetical protein